MKKILKIFKRDVLNICKRPFAIVILVGLMIIPSLYAWFNIVACWDPYSNTNGLDVAVVNLDKGTKIIDVDINTGKDIVANLATNNQIGWDFVQKDDAMEGLNTGKYYAVVVVPENFTKEILSVISLNIKRPEIEYYVNQKKNAIAPKITDKAIETIQNEVNQTFIKTASSGILSLLEATFLSVEDKGSVAIKDINDKLSDLDSSLKTLSESTTAIKAATNSVSSLIDTSILLLPDIDSSLKEISSSADNVKTLVNSSKDVTNNLSQSLDTNIAAVKTMISQLETSLDSLSSDSKSDVSKIINKLLTLNTYSNNITTQNNNIITVLKNINGSLPVSLSGIDNAINKLNELNDYQTKLKNAVNSTIDNTKSHKKLLDKDISNLKGLISSSINTLDVASNTYKTEISPNINKTLDDAYTTIGSLSTIVSNAKKDIPDFKSSLKKIKNAIKQTNVALDSVKNLTDDAVENVNKFKASIEDITKNADIKSTVETLQKNPELISQFLSSPVKVQEKDIYPIANYGSAMTPFYTILCLWVGALVLAAVLKTDVNEDDKIKNISPTVAYFGRYQLFLVTSIFQALIVCLGDILLLGIQCENIPLFILCGIIASFIFSNIVYTLTISFGTIGKALAVIFLVIQVAGAGGTFPIEVLPKFFQILNPIMPFKYGIDAMRETVAGVYTKEYVHNILMLLAYLPGSLLIGLFLRIPILKIKKYLAGKLEETDVII